QEQASIEDTAADACCSIDLAARSVNMDQIRNLCRDLMSYKRVAAFGLLKAEAAAVSLQSDLMMLGKLIYTNVSCFQQMQYLQEAGPEDLILIFSYTGSYFEGMGRPAANGARIWMISGQKKKYPACVSRTLHFESLHNQAGHPYSLMIVTGLIAQEYARMIRK
ncbi:MAG: MurR/RpiR family transcriptional regulator, partial [Erysipelotrichaceae bacterium]|nr:MurR/RpiR family transcriptional regulator [Erysipelotrichaceae bacterium]